MMRKWSADEVKGELYKLEKNIVRQRIIKGEPRIDGRDKSTVRPIDVEVGTFCHVHTVQPCLRAVRRRQSLLRNVGHRA